MNPAQTGAHPSAEEVDATLDPSDAAPEVVEHVNGCPRCSGLRDGLVEVRALLRQESQRVHEPPSDLGERIAAALGAAPEVPADGTGRIRHRRPAAAWLALAAGFAVVAGSAAVAVQAASSDGQDVASSLQESSGAQPDAAQPDAAQSDAAESLAAESLAEESGAGGGAADTRVEGGVPELLEAAVPAVDTGTDYRPADLSSQVTALLAPAPAAGAAPQGRGSAADDADRSLADPAALQECLVAIGAGGPGRELPLAVDLARWQGQDAAVLVLPDSASAAGPGAAGRVEIWVVSRSCGPADPAVLHFARVEP